MGVRSQKALIYNKMDDVYVIKHSLVTQKDLLSFPIIFSNLRFEKIKKSTRTLYSLTFKSWVS